MKVAVVLGTRPEIIKVMNALIVRFFSEVNMAKILVTGGLGYIDLTRPLNSEKGGTRMQYPAPCATSLINHTSVWKDFLFR